MGVSLTRQLYRMPRTIGISDHIVRFHTDLWTRAMSDSIGALETIIYKCEDFMPKVSIFIPSSSATIH